MSSRRSRARKPDIKIHRELQLIRSVELVLKGMAYPAYMKERADKLKEVK